TQRVDRRDLLRQLAPVDALRERLAAELDHEGLAAMERDVRCGANEIDHRDTLAERLSKASARRWACPGSSVSGGESRSTRGSLLVPTRTPCSSSASRTLAATRPSSSTSPSRSPAPRMLTIGPRMTAARNAP